MSLGTIRHNPTVLFAICCLAYIASGLLGVLPSAGLTLLAQHTHVALGTAGLAFTGSAFGSIIAVLLSSLFIKKIGAKPVIMLGLAGLTIASLIIPTTPIFTFWLAAQVLQGMSGSFISIGLSITMTLNFRQNLGEKLNMLYSFAGVGSLLAPLLLSFTMSLTGSLLVSFVIVALVSLTCLLAFNMLRFVSKEAPATTSTGSNVQVSDKASMSRIFKHTLLWFMALQICLYVGAEAGFSNWLVTSISQSANVAVTVATPAATFFWIGMALGRVTVAQLIKRGLISDVHLLYACILGGGLSGILVTASLNQPYICFIGSLLEGFCIGPIFPSLQSMATRRFSHSPTLVSSMVLMSAGLAGMTVPLSIGMLIPFLGTRGGMIIPALLCLCVAVPFSLANRSERQVVVHRRGNVQVEPVSTPMHEVATRELPAIPAFA
ncbi:MFS transporter [Ktedonobacter sp. SOSP1-52]|uniref:MFS transporter n=1 Tax=Ktedonobacter sp. SOSP1-52 TaxID=2778366 RepID=UPI0019156F83|nr:MFS transporter [Ktedonobacter sp. SOSP1-52]GHO67794.1 MFS transporter [Ktedonobacter sp. SOSP1-52]